MIVVDLLNAMFPRKEKHVLIIETYRDTLGKLPTSYLIVIAG